MIYVIEDFNGEETVGRFHEKKLQKTKQPEFTIENLIKTKGDRQYSEWKGYDNSLHSWIDKKDMFI